MSDQSPSTVEDLHAHAARIRQRDGYQDPAAFGLGIATFADADGSILDTWFPFRSLGADADADVAAVLSDACGALADGGGPEGTFRLDAAALESVRGAIAPLRYPGHPVAEVVDVLAGAPSSPSPLPVTKAPVVTFLADLDAPPVDAHDVYLRLHLLSSRLVKPHGLSLEGQFGLLSNVVWTNLGPCDVATFESARTRLRSAGTVVAVSSIDKFPRMVDYVVPTGVRIADAERVRLGAHLAEGTTVMHEGFVNFNAGTLGNAMIEGRISAGVVVGPDSDLGGGASIMGTLSGGGKEVVSVGSNCLIGANAGIGISLGDRCIVEAGLYVTAGTIVTLPDGTTRKARELSGAADLLYRRNSVTGRVEVVPRAGTWSEGLNAELHAN